MRKIQLACGRNRLQDWENYDSEVDIIERLPFDDKSVDIVFIEHGIEHITYKQAEKFIREVYRVLKKDGIFRIATPSFRKIIENANPKYMKRAKGKGWAEVETVAGVVNSIFYCHNHKFIYDFETLKKMLTEQGFQKVEEFVIGEGSNEETTNLEQHGRIVGEENNRIDTLVVEAIC